MTTREHTSKQREALTALARGPLFISNATDLRRNQINALAARALVLRGDCETYLAGDGQWLRLATPCPVRSEPWDDSATMNCQKPLDHDGCHRYCAEWDDNGRFTDDD